MTMSEPWMISEARKWLGWKLWNLAVWIHPNAGGGSGIHPLTAESENDDWDF